MGGGDSGEEKRKDDSNQAITEPGVQYIIK